MNFASRMYVGILALTISMMAACSQQVLIDPRSERADAASFFESTSKDHQVYIARAYWTGTTDVVADGPSLRGGDVDGRVPALKRRLVSTGDLQPETVTHDRVYDPVAVEGVRSFQERYGLVTDGVVGPRTREALNGPSGLRQSTVFAEPHIVMVLDRGDDGFRLAPEQYFLAVPAETVSSFVATLNDDDTNIYPLLISTDEASTVHRLGYVVTHDLDGSTCGANYEVAMARAIPGRLRGLVFASSDETSYVISHNGRSLDPDALQEPLAAIEPSSSGVNSSRPTTSPRPGDFLVLGEAADRGTDRGGDDRDSDRDRNDSGGSDRDSGDSSGPDSDPGGGHSSTCDSC